jgi:paraquat-inducible protein A
MGFDGQSYRRRFSETLNRGGFLGRTRKHIFATIGGGASGVGRAEAVLPLTLTGLILTVPAATLPVVTVSRFGSDHSGWLFSGVGALWSQDMPALGVWVLICGSLTPLVLLASLLLPTRLTGRTVALARFNRIALAVAEWSMPEVQVLAILVAVAKIGSLVHITLGAGFWCYLGMSLALLCAWSAAHSQWRASEAPPEGDEMEPPSARSASAAAALGLGAVIMLVPANLLPVIRTTIGQTRDDTIYSGIVSLFDRGLGGVGLIVFVASILVPILKLAGLTFLLIAAKRGPGQHLQHLQQIYAIMNFIGRWSMLDVFLIAFLAGVIQFGSFASVQPQPGIIAFAVAVVLTMLATRAFDPRLLEHAAQTKKSS